MNAKYILSTRVSERNSLRILKSDIGYHFELFTEGKLAFGSYFLYGEKLHKVALCIGGSIYGLLQDDELSESVMKVIHDNEHLLGGDEMKR